MIVQPFSSCLVVIVRPSASVAEEVATDREPPEAPEREETLTEELDEDDDRAAAEAEAAFAEPGLDAVSARERVCEPSRAILITSHSSSCGVRDSPAAAAETERAAPAAMRWNERFMSLSDCAKGRGRERRTPPSPVHQKRLGPSASASELP